MSRLQEINDWAHSQIDPKFIDESYWQGLQDGARWADRTMLDKACVWLKSFLEGPMGEGLAKSITEEFRKIMEE